MADEFTEETLQSLTLFELQQELRKRGLKKSGPKPKLVQRLIEHLQKNGIDANTEETETPEEEKMVVEPKVVQIEEPHPFNAEYKKQLEDAANNEQYDNDVNEARDMAEEFTMPIHGENARESYERHVEGNCFNEGKVTAVTEERNITVELTKGTSSIENSTSSNQETTIIQGEMEGSVKLNKEKSEAEKMPSITDVLHTEDATEEALDYDEIEDEVQENDADDREHEEASSDVQENDFQAKGGENADEIMETAAEDQAGKGGDEASENKAGIAGKETGEEKEEGELNDEEQEVKIEKPKPKPIVPVALKKSRVSLAASTESAEERAARRKRRWGSASVKQKTVTISSESIKKLIPDVKIDAAALEEAAEYDEKVDAEIGKLGTAISVEEVDEEVTMEDENKEDGEDKDISESASNGSARNKTGRTVTVDSGGKKVTLGKRRQSSDAPTTITVDDDSEHAPKQIKAIQVLDDIEDGDNRDKPPSPARHSVSCFLHISNLVRPFTVNQLKGLIQRTSKICENGFWINTIKSHCYVKLSSEDEASATRDALHGLKWPSGTPKKLDVDFATNGRVYQETDGAIGVKEKVVIEIDDKENEVVRNDKPTNRNKDGTVSRRRSRSDHKAVEKSRDKNTVSERKTKETRAKERDEESPAKLLDDLFRKTKATPCIYWLPLTEDQIIERERKKNQVKRSRDRQTRDRQPREHRSPDRRRQSPSRRSHNDRGNASRSWR